MTTLQLIWHWRLWFVLMASSLMCGCGSNDEIRSYTAAKEKGPVSLSAAIPAPVRAADAADRMLGAIVPAGDQSWFFKVTGPAAAVDNHAEAIKAFFHTIQLSAAAEKPTWKTPQGWEELGPSGMRAATLKIPSDSQPLEMSVIGSSGTLLDNVNRWRGQLQLPPIDERTLAETVEESKAGEAKMWIVDLRGKASGGGMTAPFAGGAGAPSRPTSPAERQTLGLPADHPPVAADGGPVNAADAVPFKFTVPESWQPHPATGMRRLAFIVEDGQRRAEVTVIDLMASAPSIADPLQNINRWRMEIGMAPTTKDQLDRLAREIKVDNKPTNYIELIPDPAEAAESQAKQATIAAAVPAGNMIWFFKMRGDRDLVVAERDKFKSFLDSIRFQSDGGAGDGN